MQRLGRQALKLAPSDQRLFPPVRYNTSRRATSRTAAAQTRPFVVMPDRVRPERVEGRIA
jgi:hypothetical protein